MPEDVEVVVLYEHPVALVGGDCAYGWFVCGLNGEGPVLLSPVLYVLQCVYDCVLVMVVCLWCVALWSLVLVVYCWGCFPFLDDLVESLELLEVDSCL